MVFLHTFRGRGRGGKIVAVSYISQQMSITFCYLIVWTWESTKYIVFVVVPTINKPQKCLHGLRQSTPKSAVDARLKYNYISFKIYLTIINY